MKVQITVKIVGLFILTMSVIGCDNLSTTCDEINQKEFVMLLDVSDKNLFAEIKNDIKTNFSFFMKESPFEKAKECETLKMSIGHLSAVDELSIKSAEIGIIKKGLSGIDKNRLSSPAPLINLLKNSLEKYTEMSLDLKYNNSTNILQTVVKAIIGMGDDSDNTLLISSDFIINNKTEKVNFYKNIPNDVGGTLRKLIDPDLLSKYKEKIASGMELKVIVIHKTEINNRVNKKIVKVFWMKCFQELEITDVQFIDNLTNKIIWD